MARNCLIFVLLLSLSPCRADTFTSKTTGQTLHGYATSKTLGSKTLVRTTENGRQYIKLADYEIQPNHLGRQNTIPVISITEPLMLEIEAKAIAGAITTLADRGPLFILIEIDCPGGRVDLAKDICNAITKLNHCQTVAFITGGKTGGAFSAATAISLACDKIYMATNSSIGAATVTSITDAGQVSVAKAHGKIVGRKISSAWQSYLASLAQSKNRPAVIVKAMENKDLEVIEVEENGIHSYIESINKKSTQNTVHIWSTIDSLLTLTASQAVKCGIADGVTNSQNDVLLKLNAENAKVIPNNDAKNARGKFELIQKKAEKIIISLDRRAKQLDIAKSKREKMSLVTAVIRDYRNLLKLAKMNSDLHISVLELEKGLNSLLAIQKDIEAG